MIPRIYHVDTVGAFFSREALHEKVVAFAEAEFDRRGKCPFIWAVYDGERVVWIETPWESDREKATSVNLVKVFLKISKARAYANVIEAWVAAYHADESGEFPKNHRAPREMPGREDVLLITSYDKNGAWQGTRYKVTVRDHGYNFLGPRDDETFGGGKGMLGGMLFNLFEEEIQP